MAIINYVGSVGLSNSANAQVEFDKCNVNIVYSPVYLSFENILYDSIKKLKGYRLTAEIELLFLASDLTSASKYQSALVFINEINGNLKRDLKVNFIGTTKSLTFDSQTNDISYRDVLSDNQKVGYKLVIKLEQSKIIPPNYLPNSWYIIQPAQSNIISAGILIENLLLN